MQSEARALSVAACLLLLVPAAWAGRKRKAPEPEAPPPVAEEPAPPPSIPLWAGWPTPIDHGGVPQGLATASAQGCNACHDGAYQGWAGGPHAGAGSEAFWERAGAAGAACTSCHLPLARQRPNLTTFDGDDVNAPVSKANPHWDATLQTEGVTCAACHIREARVLASTPRQDTPAAHPQLGWSADLDSAAACSSCHQLAWPGADQPLYDTVGEWQRSAYPAAGVDCVTCHMPQGHQIRPNPQRAFTLEVGLQAPQVTRGQPIEARISVMNTGAGHAMPTASPWKALDLTIQLELAGPKASVQSQQTVTFERTLAEESPFATLDDTRLQAGMTHITDWQGEIPTSSPSGPWELVVKLQERSKVSGQVSDVIEQRIALIVD